MSDAKADTATALRLILVSMQGLPKTRENAIAITHVETAILWLEKKS